MALQIFSLVLLAVGATALNCRTVPAVWDMHRIEKPPKSAEFMRTGSTNPCFSIPIAHLGGPNRSWVFGNLNVPISICILLTRPEYKTARQTAISQFAARVSRKVQITLFAPRLCRLVLQNEILEMPIITRKFTFRHELH